MLTSSGRRLFTPVVWTLGLTLLLFASAQAGRMQRIQCGDVLGPGGTFTLQGDLTCPTPKTSATPVLTVLDATLKLNGHTVRCSIPQHASVGLLLRAGNVRNGRVTGCGIGVDADNNSVVKHLTLISNDTGVRLFGHDNLVIGNTAFRNERGFDLSQTAHSNLLLDNLARRNDEGFFLGPGGMNNTLFGNTARDNALQGFLIVNHGGLTLVGNTASRNGSAGFHIFHTPATVSGNLAWRNGAQGFIFWNSQQLQADHNVARDNGDDGFVILSDVAASATTLMDNYARRNRGHGIHVLQNTPNVTITGNTAIDHRAPAFDLADDNAACQGTAWQDNTFETKSPPCIQ